VTHFAIPPDPKAVGQPLRCFLDPEAGSSSFHTPKWCVSGGVAACWARDLVTEEEIKEVDLQGPDRI
jgi:hypothetical protein